MNAEYRRLHLLIGDSNMSPYATALKVGLTALVLKLLEEDCLPRQVALFDAVAATQSISHECNVQTVVRLMDGQCRTALEIQHSFYETAYRHLGGRDEETDWLLANWRFVLESLESKPQALLGGVDWLSKKWLLEAFREEEGLDWQDPWLESLDLEYHNLNPEKGLFFAVQASGEVARFNESAFFEAAFTQAPQDTRAAGRGLAVAQFIGEEDYLVNWDSISNARGAILEMPDPLKDYRSSVRDFLRNRRAAPIRD
ncbi:MAG: proteasome accessory factor PafA2 family protein [Chthoniobacteraceae bacterium]